MQAPRPRKYAPATVLYLQRAPRPKNLPPELHQTPCRRSPSHRPPQPARPFWPELAWPKSTKVHACHIFCTSVYPPTGSSGRNLENARSRRSSPWSLSEPFPACHSTPRGASSALRMLTGTCVCMLHCRPTCASQGLLDLPPGDSSGPKTSPEHWRVLRLTRNTGRSGCPAYPGQAVGKQAATRSQASHAGRASSRVCVLGGARACIARGSLPTLLLGSHPRQAEHPSCSCLLAHLMRRSQPPETSATSVTLCQPSTASSRPPL